MCVIIHKPADMAISLDTLDACMMDNSDGWGLMWHQDGAARYIKSRDMRLFMGHYRALADRELGIHFRLRTHGRTDDNRAHPYEVLDNEHPMPLLLMHNGIFSGYDDPAGIRSDTELWIEQILRPIIAPSPHLWEEPLFWSALKSEAMGQRLLLLNAAGEFRRVGSWEMSEGLHFSNTHHEWSVGRPYDLGGSTSGRNRSAVLRFEQFSLIEIDNMDIEDMTWMCQEDPEGAAATIRQLLDRALA